MEKNTTIIIVSIVCFIQFAVSGFLGLNTWQLNQKLAAMSIQLQEIRLNPHAAITREFEAKNLYESAAQTYLNTFTLVDSTLQNEAQTHQRLNHESFARLFNDSFRGFTASIQMAEQLLSDYPETYYQRQISTDGLFIAGNYYSIPVLRENRDAILQKLMANRGEAVAHLIKEECKLIDKAISQCAVDKRLPAGARIVWDDLLPYFHPHSRLAQSKGNDIYGNPFSIGEIDPRTHNVKISTITHAKFKSESFDWGPYAP